MPNELFKSDNDIFISKNDEKFCRSTPLKDFNLFKKDKKAN